MYDKDIVLLQVCSIVWQRYCDVTGMFYCMTKILWCYRYVLLYDKDIVMLQVCSNVWQR